MTKAVWGPADCLVWLSLCVCERVLAVKPKRKPRPEPTDVV